MTAPLMNEHDRTPLLVFGDDGTAPSDRAWEWIVAHSWSGWAIDVLTADADPAHVTWGEPVEPTPWNPSWPRDGDRIDTPDVRFLTAATDPRAMLAEVDADLVVLGITTEGPLGSMAGGSTTEWMLHHPPSPLVVVRTPATTSRVLVCVDGSGHASLAIDAFLGLPLAHRTDVTVLTVDDGRVDTSAAEKEAGRLAPHVSSVSPRIVAGRPSEAILAAAGASGTDLIVLGTRGLTGWKRLRLGSTASAVVRATSCNSLVACADV